MLLFDHSEHPGHPTTSPTQSAFSCAEESGLFAKHHKRRQSRRTKWPEKGERVVNFPFRLRSIRAGGANAEKADLIHNRGFTLVAGIEV